MVNLYLFDIDGTLVNINYVHLEACKLDYKGILGYKLPARLIASTFGMVEKEAYYTICKALKIIPIEKPFQKIISIHNENFKKALARKRVLPLKGVVTLLEYLKKKKQIIGIITANLKIPGELILKKSRLKKYFKLFSFDDGKSRKKEEIIRSALKLAKKKRYKFEKIIVIGDTIQDIKAAKSVHAFSVAVSTGSIKHAQLKKHNPDLLIRSLSQYREIIKSF